MSLTDSKNIVIPSVIVLAILGIISFFPSDDPTTESKVIQKNTSEVVTEIEQPQREKKSDEERNVISEDPIPEVATQEEQLERVERKTVPEVNFIEGADYITKFPNEIPKSPVLVEFFSFMCPHCFNFEPTMRRWIAQKPKSVELLRVPVSFGRTGPWGLSARAYYVAEELNVQEQFSKAIFRKIHIEKKTPRSTNDIGKIFLTLGINERAFKKANSSFSVDSKLRKAEFLTKKYKVSGVPYFLINKKYETGKDSYESEQTLFRLWNQLPAKDF